ncbi:MAG: IS1595 family transposase [Azonexus sp.]|jgi:transposase-like protein|uniref:IS1595 family transposase n=1 Tax=Azonexus sp. TaxID=1872668 RepID=UPI0028285306|nr:IS1595 family transposase [Azonexus sp.]MDR0776204.1 IS1595 family transposase [Azonexus sp.]
MTVHFWLSTDAITITQESIGTMTDDQARLFLAELRWGSVDQQVCPECGAVDRHYHIRTRRQWRCKHCFHTFSVTSGTPFTDRKIGYRRLLLALFAFVINQKGLAALALRRMIGGQYRTSFTLLHKLREAIMLTTSQDQLGGVVEMDGGHFSGRKRKGRKKKGKPKKPQVPNKYAEHRSKAPQGAFPFHPNRRIIVALREISQETTGAINKYNGKPIGKGATRTVVAVCRSENNVDVEALIRKHVATPSTIRTDEMPSYGNVKFMGYIHQVVNHSIEFSSDEGYNENQAESFFSRMRRACIGIYHRITPKYMLDYATETAWREDVRRKDTRTQLAELFSRVGRAGLSKDWINYCRGNRRRIELLFQGNAGSVGGANPLPVGN